MTYRMPDRTSEDAIVREDGTSRYLEWTGLPTAGMRRFNTAESDAGSWSDGDVLACLIQKDDDNWVVAGCEFTYSGGVFLRYYHTATYRSSAGSVNVGDSVTVTAVISSYELEQVTSGL